ncbi:MAG TPA: FUSC family protein [Terracidiphilus sp.]|nr:FUSC family protein [Terracidiphilus sp.]
MRLKARKTWSQQQLTVKLRMHSKASQGLLNLERRRLLIHAAKTALAAALSWWLAKLFGVRDGYWGSISAIIVLQSNVGATVTASRDRIIGTVIGAALGFAFSPIEPVIAGYILALLAAIVVCGLLGLKNSSRLAGVTVTIVILVHREGTAWSLALDRVIEVLLGIVVALAVTTLVVPDRARIHLRDGLAQEFLLLGAFFEAILEGFRGEPAATLQSLRDDVQATRQGNDLLLEASRNEPSSAGWNEGLNMLSQFVRSIFDALLALELAVRDSHEDAYAQRLEPELGKLAADIRSGFNHVASCIHKWRFESLPQGFNLESDVAELDKRMESVRGTGLGFTQAEIFRAYAVQLHLKQIAQLLRASRVETSRATGEAREQGGKPG